MFHIVFWLGRSRSPWNHRTAIEEGCGGSELAALRLSAGLAALGFRVTVYADVLEDDAQDVNPRWLSYKSYEQLPMHRAATCDLLVSSRCSILPHGIRAARSSLHKPTWLWMHDLHVGADWTNDIASGYDHIICLSNFAQKRFCDYYPKVDYRKMSIIPNGLASLLFAPSAYKPFGSQHERLRSKIEPLTAIWSSCPDRGLDRVLDLWPAIRDVFPGAQLRVFGGILAWASQLEGYGTEEQISFSRTLMNKIGRLVDVRQLDGVELPPSDSGVIFEGRAGQARLAQAFSTTHLWLYPTGFEETSCITALEAQAGGCKIICTPVGALLETAPYAKVLPEWAPTQAWRNVTMEMVREYMLSPYDEHLRTARNNVPTWIDVSRKWKALIEQKVTKSS